jgi:hypothetical protein
MNNEHYDEIGRTEDFSMISTMDDGEWSREIACIHRVATINKQFHQTMHSLADIPCFAEEVILHSEADLHGHEEITEGVALNNIYEVALENEIYLEQGPSINKYG